MPIDLPMKPRVKSKYQAKGITITKTNFLLISCHLGKINTMDDSSSDEELLQQLTEQVLSLDLEALYYVNFWRADEKVCLAIGNYDHSILRNAKGKGPCDMPGARDELNNFAEKILEFGFKQ